jgi:hypothetical protein
VEEERGEHSGDQILENFESRKEGVLLRGFHLLLSCSLEDEMLVRAEGSGHLSGSLLLFLRVTWTSCSLFLRPRHWM